MPQDYQEQIQEYRYLCSNLPDPMLVVGKGGEILMLSKKLEELSGYKEEELIGKNIFDLPLIAPKDKNLAIENLKKRLTGEKIAIYTVEVITKIGERMLAELSGCKIKYRGEDASLLIMRDVTERKKTEEALRENEEKFRAIFDYAKDGILVADIENRKFLMGNNAICQMLGYSSEEISSLGVDDIHPEKDLPYVMSQFEKQAKGDFSLAKDLPVKRKDGSVFYADVNAGSIKIGKKTHLLGFFHDTTERKKLEERLNKTCEDLEKINQHLVGRELKMTELKKKIEQLESRNKNEN